MLILEDHLLPALGHQRLDEIRIAEIEGFKAEMKQKAPAKGKRKHLSQKTINNTLTVLRKLLWALTYALKAAGITREHGRIGWHDPRHTYASHLVMRGTPLKVVQELLGHATIEMTMRYAHLSPEAKREAVQCLDLPPPAPTTPEGHKWGTNPAHAANTARNLL